MINSNLSSPLSILIGSFNIHKLFPPSDVNFSSWLTHPSHLPHIIAIGLQELSPIWSFQKQKSEYHWKNLFDKTLPNHQLYSHVRLHSNNRSLGFLIHSLHTRFASFHLYSILPCQSMFIHGESERSNCSYEFYSEFFNLSLFSQRVSSISMETKAVSVFDSNSNKHLCVS